MKFSSHFLVYTFIFIHTASLGSCWQFFTSINDLVLTDSIPDQMYIHSEYHFGHCKVMTNKIFYTHVHLDRMDVLGKIIIRGWIKVMRIPTCILLRGMSYDRDLVQSSTYNFQFCVPRITYCHTHRRFKFHYYEWYMPKDYSGGMDWDMYFFGPPNQFWQ